MQWYEWYPEVLKKYAVFNGRARRAEFWWFSLVNFVISFVIGIIDQAIGAGGVIQGLYGLAVLLPGLAVSVRRLHDTDRSGWWILIGFIPLLGFIVLLVFFLLDGTPGPNKYGPSPKHGGAASPAVT